MYYYDNEQKLYCFKAADKILFTSPVLGFLFDQHEDGTVTLMGHGAGQAIEKRYQVLIDIKSKSGKPLFNPVVFINTPPQSFLDELNGILNNTNAIYLAMLNQQEDLSTSLGT